MCVKGHELYVLDSSLRRIIVYDLGSMTWARRYNWGEFVGDKEIRRLYTDETGQIYFSAGRNVQRLYRLRDQQFYAGVEHQERTE